MLHSGHVTVRVVSFFGASQHCNSPKCGKDSEGGLTRVSGNNTCFTLSTAQDFCCWHHWNQRLALARVIKGLAIAAPPCILNLWSWDAHLILQWVGQLCFWLQSGLAPGHPFQTASSCVESFSCWMWFVLHGGMQTLPWIPWLSMHHKGWSQMCQRDMSPIMSCALQNIALTGRMCNQRSLATRLCKYSHVSSNTILASISVSLSNPFTLNVYH